MEFQENEIDPVTPVKKGLLVLTRKVGEVAVLRHGNLVIEVLVVKFIGQQVRLGFKAPKDVQIERSERLSSREGEAQASDRILKHSDEVEAELGRECEKCGKRVSALGPWHAAGKCSSDSCSRCKAHEGYGWGHQCPEHNSKEEGAK